jgi:thiamine biosynthesis lipoprotein
MRSYRFPAMGTEVHVLLPADRGGAITPVRELFADWEARLSRFLPDSELSQLNARASERVVVSSLLFGVVTACVDAARATGGAFDPTLLRQLVRIGYAEPFSRMPPSAEPAPGSAEGGGRWRSIVLDPGSRAVTLPAGCALDLGGIAKGMAVDTALDMLGRRSVAAALVSAGGDLAVRGLPTGARAWPVLVGDDLEGEIVPLVRGALATSGVARRSWSQAGIPRHHLVDPRTGEPVESSLSEVTVAAPTCKMAEVGATASFVLGPDLGAELLRRHGLAGRLTRDDGSRLTVGPWPSSVPNAA